MKHIHQTRLQLAALLIFLASSFFASAQMPQVVASGFDRAINGLTRDAQGNLWVTESGTGQFDGRVSMITPAGTVYTVIDGLPSIIIDTMTNESAGAWVAHHRGAEIFVLTSFNPASGGGALLRFDFTDYTPGGTPLGLASSTGALDIGPFVFGAGFMESNPYRVLWGADGDPRIVDAAANSVLRYHTAGDSFSILHTFPPIPNTFTPFPPVIDYVPTSIAANPAGGYFVGNLTGFPFLPGLSNVVQLDDAGAVTPFAAGLSQIVELQVDSATGDLFALQFAQFDSTFSPMFGSARITRISPAGAQTVVAAGFGPSTGMALDGQGGAYVTNLFTGQVQHLTGITAAAEPKRTLLTALQLAPNPALDASALRFELQEAARVSYSVHDARGAALRTVNLGNRPAGAQTVTMDLSGLPSGVLTVVVNAEGQVSSLRVIRP